MKKLMAFAFIWIGLLSGGLALAASDPASSSLPPAPVAGAPLAACPLRILVVYFQPVESDEPVAMHRALTQTLAPHPGQFEIYSESIDIERFDAPYQAALAEFLAKKYSDHPIDIIVAAEGMSAAFLERLRPTVFPTQPFIFATPQQTVADAVPGADNCYSIADKPDYAGNFQLIHDLLPSCRTLVFAGQLPGPNPRQSLEQQVLPLARKQFPEVRDLSDLSLGRLREELPRLPADSAVFIGGRILDGDSSRVHAFSDLPGQVAGRSPVPVFAFFAPLVKDGVVGGKVIRSEARGQAIAEAILRIADHQPPVRIETRQTCLFDYRALQRFGLERRPLPPDSLVLNHPPTFREVHPRILGGGLAAILLLLAASIILLVLLRLRRRAVVALRQSEARLRAIFNATDDAFFIHDQETGAILEVNRGMTQLYGYSPEEACALSLADLSSGMPPYSQAEALAWFRRAAAGEPQSFEWRAIDRAGRLFWVDVRMTQVRLGGQDRILVAVRDIDEQKKAQVELVESRELKRALIDSSPDLIWSVDAERFGLLTFNQALSGYFRQRNGIEIKPGDRPEDLLSADYASRWREMYRRALADGPYVTEHQVLDSPMAMELRFNLLQRNGAVSGISVFGKDISEKRQTEQALRESEGRYRHFVEKTTEGFYRLEADGPIPLDRPADEVVRLMYRHLYLAECNDAFAKMYGYGSGVEMAGMRFVDLHGGDSVPENLEALQAFLLAGCQMLNVETREVGRDGKEVVLSNNSVGIVENGLLVSTWGAQVDITLRKRAEEELRRSEERHRMILQTAMDGFWMADMDGRLLEVNEAFCQMCDYSRQELLAMRIADLSADETAEEIARHCQKIMVQGDFRFECWYRRKDGSVFPVDASVQYQPAEGRLVAFVCDISERKWAEMELEQHRNHLEDLVAVRTRELDAAKAALADSLARYDNLVDQSHSIILEWDPDGNILFLNRWGLEFFGFSREEVLGRNVVGTIVAPVDASGEDLSRKMQKIQKNPDDFYSSENENLRKDGSRVWISWSNKGIVGRDGRLLKTLSIGIDRTLQRRNELSLGLYREQLEKTNEALCLARQAAESANLAKSSFLANMSHELRTPLTAILGFAELMSREPSLSGPARESLSIIVRSGEHLLSLINDILDLSKIEAGRVNVDFRDVDLDELVRDVVNMMRGRAEAKGLRLILDQASDCPRFVNTDAGKLRQILVNLVGNAVKFTAAGQVAVAIRALATEDGHDLKIEVSDTGCGIGPEDQERIFHPFEQLRPRAGEGTGLGLAITRHCVQMLGGDISVSSHAGQGSRFCFNIRVGRPQSQPQSKPAGRKAVGIASPTGGFRILIVEDHPENRLLFNCFLEPLGFQLREAVDGQEAVEVFQEWCPHLVFMDWRMPVMDGLEATRRIRRLPGGGQASIVAVSAHSFKEEQQEMLSAGCDEFLCKPFGSEELFSLLNRRLHLELVYEAEVPPELPVPLVAEDLRGVEAGSLGRLLQFAVEGDEFELRKWLETETGLPSSARKGLAQLVKDYRFDVIEELIASLGVVSAEGSP